MKDAVQLWQWPGGTGRGEVVGIFYTVEAAIDASHVDRSEWVFSPNARFYVPLADGDRTGRYQSWSVSPVRVPETDAVGSVQIHGREMILGFEGWDETGDLSKSHYETIQTDQVVVLSAADLALRCYDTTVMDYFETVHPRRIDGTCHCGEPTRNARP